MKIWIFGDSFVHKYGFSNAEFLKNSAPWLDRIATKYSNTVENLSHSGQSNEGIYLSVVDMIPNISEDDIVVVSWSAPGRFLGTSNRDTFTRYTDSSPKHICLWSNKPESIDLGTVAELHPILSSILEMSICTLGLAAILRNNNIKFKFINGHYEFHDCLPANVAESFLLSDSRTYTRSENNYYALDDFIQLKHGYCLVNNFFMFLIETLEISPSEISKIKKQCYDRSAKKIDYDKFCQQVLEIDRQQHNPLLHDVWHLSCHGHERFAEYIAPYITRSLFK